MPKIIGNKKFEDFDSLSTQAFLKMEKPGDKSDADITITMLCLALWAACDGGITDADVALEIALKRFKYNWKFDPNKKKSRSR